MPMPPACRSACTRNICGICSSTTTWAEGRFEAGGRPIALTDIRVPIFAVGTVRDHVAPWRSTFKIQLLTDTEVTFLLTTGGHNVGIVSEPGRLDRSYQVMTKQHADAYVDPETWLARALRKKGS
jgi:polyhydroxyalkanoate synthase